jgi:hypothetical protein
MHEHPWTRSKGTVPLPQWWRTKGRKGKTSIDMSVRQIKQASRARRGPRCSQQPACRIADAGRNIAVISEASRVTCWHACCKTYHFACLNQMTNKASTPIIATPRYVCQSTQQRRHNNTNVPACLIWKPDDGPLSSAQQCVSLRRRRRE